METKYKCELESNSNELEILVRQLQREIEELSKTTTAQLLLHDGKIAECCKYLKDNLSNSIRCLLDDMRLSGELESIINDIVLNQINEIMTTLDGVVNVKNYRAVGDGETDDTRAIQDALDNGKIIIFNEGTYLVKTDTINRLKVKSNTYIIGNGATLKAINKNNDVSSVLHLENVHDVNITNLNIFGDVLENKSFKEGAGNGINITGCENIFIDNVRCENCFTDGIYIRGNNIVVKNSICTHNGRQGISITHGENIIIDNVECSDSFRVAPKSGVDIEPSLDNDYVDNITLRNVRTINNKGLGFAIGLHNMVDRISCNIILDNCYDDRSDAGSIEIGSHSPNVKMSGSIIVNNFTSKNSPLSGVTIRPRNAKKCVPVLFNNLVIENANTSETTMQYGRAIYFYDGSANDKSGNVKFNGITFNNCEKIVDYIYTPQNLEEVYVSNTPEIKDVISSINYVGEYPNSVNEITASGVYSIMTLFNFIRVSEDSSVVFRTPVYATNDVLTIVHDTDSRVFYEFKIPILNLSANGKLNSNKKGSVLQLLNVKNQYYLVISKSGEWN